MRVTFPSDGDLLASERVLWECRILVECESWQRSESVDVESRSMSHTSFLKPSRTVEAFVEVIE